jgi:hypothetical protein
MGISGGQNQMEVDHNVGLSFCCLPTSVIRAPMSVVFEMPLQCFLVLETRGRVLAAHEGPSRALEEP